MTIQIIRPIVVNGTTVKPGTVLIVPDHVGTVLLQQGAARPHERPGPTEFKDAPLPPEIPNVRVPAPPAPVRYFEPGAYEDRDNFVRDLVTLAPLAWIPPWDWNDGAPPAPPVTPSPSASDRDPLLTIEEIKIHCHIELDQTDEDNLLEQYEMAARLHTENYLAYQVDETVGENIKQACLLLIAHWYRNREAVSTGRGSVGTEMPLAYKALLSMERDYPVY